MFSINCGLPVPAADISGIPIFNLNPLEKKTVICWTSVPYLEVIDQFLDVPVFNAEIFVTLWTAQRLLLLLFTL